MRQVAHGDVIHGTLHVAPAMRAALQEALLVWPDGPVTLTVEQATAARSPQANAYYWGVVVKALSSHTGYSPDEIHEILKVKFLPKDVALLRGNGHLIAEFVIGGSTTQLGVSEFFEYVEQIRQWAFEALDVDIPPPNPAWREEQEVDDGQRSLAGGAVGPPRLEAGGGRRGHRRLGEGGVVASAGGPGRRAGAG